MDPIGADGNLFFKGFFLVMLGLHLRTTGDERGTTRSTSCATARTRSRGSTPRSPSTCTSSGPTHAGRLPLREHEGVAVLPRRRRARPAAARPAARHRPPRGVHAWWNDVCRDRYLHLDGDELPRHGDALLRPDPRRRTTRSRCSRAWSRRSTSRRRSPTRRAVCSRPGMRQLGLWEPPGRSRLPGPRASATALWLAREWGLDGSSNRARRARSTSTYQPTLDTAAASSRGASSSTRSTRAASTTGRWPPRRSRPRARGGGSPTSARDPLHRADRRGRRLPDRRVA